MLSASHRRAFLPVPAGNAPPPFAARGRNAAANPASRPVCRKRPQAEQKPQDKRSMPYLVLYLPQRSSWRAREDLFFKSLSYIKGAMYKNTNDMISHKHKQMMLFIRQTDISYLTYLGSSKGFPSLSTNTVRPPILVQ